MSTNAFICIKNEKETDVYDACYVHYDGYPTYMLDKLNSCYASKQLARKLVDLNGIPFLDDSIEKITNYTDAPKLSISYNKLKNKLGNHFKYIRFVYLFDEKNNLWYLI